MQVRRITTWPELAALQHEWNALAAQIPFRSWDWLATWWKHYGGVAQNAGAQDRASYGSRQLYVLAAYADAGSDIQATGKLIGIAPWYLDRSAIKGNVLKWLGSGEVCTDHLSLICQPEDSAKVVELFADELANTFDDWDRLELDAVDADDSAIRSFVEALKERDCSVSQQPANNSWAVELPPTWDDYLASLSKSHRKQLRQLDGRVLASDRVAWHRVHNGADLETAWSVLVDLHQRRRQSLSEPGCFASRLFHDFHREAVERLLERGQLRMSWLALDGIPAAAEYHLADGHTTYAYQGGVDPDRLNEECGRLSTILCVRQAIDEDHRRLDFMRGDEPYKAHWRATPRPTYDYHVVPNRTLSRLRGHARNVAESVTDWVRQGARLVHFSRPT